MVNKVIEIGYMCDAPEQRISKSGTAITNFKISVKKRKPDPNGTKYSRFSCVAFGKTAEYIAKHCTDQSRIAVEGVLDVSSYEKNGAKQYITKIIVDNVEIMSGTTSQNNAQPVQSMQEYDEPGESPDSDFKEVPEDDLPF